MDQGDGPLGKGEAWLDFHRSYPSQGAMLIGKMVEAWPGHHLCLQHVPERVCTLPTASCAWKCSLGRLCDWGLSLCIDFLGVACVCLFWPAQGILWIRIKI
jgi:hypothetical protein